MEKELLGNFISEARKEMGMTQQALADKLHVTNAAVSKWERGLSYPDLTLLEPLASALNMTVSELMACKRNLETPPADNSDPMRSVLDIAHASSKKQRKKIWVLAACTILCAVVIIGLLCRPNQPEEPEPSTSVTFSGDMRFFIKDIQDDGYYVYIRYFPDIGKPPKLIRLRCPDKATWESIESEEQYLYSGTYTYDTVTHEGILENCELTDPYGPMTVEGMIGAITEFGSVLGMRTYMKYIDAYKNPYVDTNNYHYHCYSVELYDYEKTTLSEGVIDGTPFLTLYDILGAKSYDYDNDGIYELFVLTVFENFSYQVYDIVDGQIVCRFIDEVPFPPERMPYWS